MSDPRALCVYCGSHVGHDPRYREAAAALGRQAAGRGVTIVFGGGRVGLMGVLADAALAGGGHVVGIIPEHLETREVGHAGVSELIVVGSMHERKMEMFRRADAFAVLPGGLGTLDEMFEIVTWRQLGLHTKPLVLVDVAGYWAPLNAMLERQIAAGFLRPAHAALIDVVDDVADVLPAIARHRAAAAPADTQHM